MPCWSYMQVDLTQLSDRLQHVVLHADKIVLRCSDADRESDTWIQSYCGQLVALHTISTNGD